MVVTQHAGTIDRRNDRCCGTGDRRAMIGTVVGWYMGALERANGRRGTEGVDGGVERSPRCWVCPQGALRGVMTKLTFPVVSSKTGSRTL